jgi:hypothetical protein
MPIMAKESVVKISYFMVSLLFFAALPAINAGERPIKASDEHSEYRMHVTRHGDHYVGRYNNHEYILRGDSSHYRVDGDYVVHGSFGSDNTYFEARELRPIEYRMRVRKHDGHYYGFYNDREYLLRGDAAVSINAEGEYVAYGEIGSDGTYFETREIAPAVVVQQPTVVVNSGAEYRMRVVHRGDRYYGIHDNHEYILRGDSVTHINAEGEYIVHGEIGADGTYFETREVRPVVVVQDPPPQQVIIVKERRDPLIKIGPLEIGR